MATKDIPDSEVVKACRDWKDEGIDAQALLMIRTDQSAKVCWRAMQRAASRGLIDYGVSLRTAWPTEKGLALLEGR